MPKQMDKKKNDLKMSKFIWSHDGFLFLIDEMADLPETGFGFEGHFVWLY